MDALSTADNALRTPETQTLWNAAALPHPSYLSRRAGITFDPPLAGPVVEAIARGGMGAHHKARAARGELRAKQRRAFSRLFAFP